MKLSIALSKWKPHKLSFGLDTVDKYWYSLLKIGSIGLLLQKMLHTDFGEDWSCSFWEKINVWKSTMGGDRWARIIIGHLSASSSLKKSTDIIGNIQGNMENIKKRQNNDLQFLRPRGMYSCIFVWYNPLPATIARRV